MFRKLIISTAFFAIQKFLISKTTYAPLRAYLNSLITPASTIADILTDENPLNVEQLKAFWEKHKEVLIQQDIALAKQIVSDKVKNVDLRDTILRLLDAITEDDLTPISHEIGGDTEGGIPTDIFN
jgi:hypothetical protein